MCRADWPVVPHTFCIASLGYQYSVLFEFRPGARNADHVDWRSLLQTLDPLLPLANKIWGKPQWTNLSLVLCRTPGHELLHASPLRWTHPPIDPSSAWLCHENPNTEYWIMLRVAEQSTEVVKQAFHFLSMTVQERPSASSCQIKIFLLLSFICMKKSLKLASAALMAIRFRWDCCFALNFSIVVRPKNQFFISLFNWNSDTLLHHI